ncbi:DJ-1/PfpI family protein [Paracoccus jiaweipingae]|uniref:DJ-1/PfpI family protein n=1 Tax=unclassified Paracoccus (in: a-proteobacteria) TaxID=2688777 RepID=UPI0037960690
MTQDTLKPILIVLTQGYADWETPLIAAAGASFYGVSVRHATPGGGDVTSMAGLRVTGLPDISLTGDEVLVLCGGDIWTGPQAPDLSSLLQAAQNRGQTVAGICAATLALGRAGLLDDVDHTSNGADFVDHFLPGYAGRGRYCDQPAAVSDGGVITAAGTAPVSFARHVLAASGVGADNLAQMQAMLGAELTS